MSRSNVPLEWSACYSVDRCAEHCTWMPCANLSLYMDRLQVLRHQLQCQKCTSTDACWHTGTQETTLWAQARFAVLPNGKATAEKCSTEMSVTLMVVLVAMIAALAVAVCVFARRQSKLRQARGMQLSEEPDGETQAQPESA